MNIQEMAMLLLGWMFFMGCLNAFILEHCFNVKPFWFEIGPHKKYAGKITPIYKLQRKDYLGAGNYYVIQKWEIGYGEKIRDRANILLFVLIPGFYVISKYKYRITNEVTFKDVHFNSIHEYTNVNIGEYYETEMAKIRIEAEFNENKWRMKKDAENKLNKVFNENYIK